MFYIGITRSNPTTRWGTDGRGYKGQPFYKYILKYGWDNFDHEVVRDNLTEKEAIELEEDLIRDYDSLMGHNGFNVSKY